MNADIDALVNKCADCRKYAYKQPRKPVLMRPVPAHASYRVVVDMFEYAGGSYLCAYDALCNFPEEELLRNTSSATVLSKLSAIVARYGIAMDVCTDEGPQFSSREFANFEKKNDFKHTISSPRLPRSDGLAEKVAQIVKRILKNVRKKE